MAGVADVEKLKDLFLSPIKYNETIISVSVMKYNLIGVLKVCHDVICYFVHSHVCKLSRAQRRPHAAPQGLFIIFSVEFKVVNIEYGFN